MVRYSNLKFSINRSNLSNPKNIGFIKRKPWYVRTGEYDLYMTIQFASFAQYCEFQNYLKTSMFREQIEVSPEYEDDSHSHQIKLTIAFLDRSTLTMFTLEIPSELDVDFHREESIDWNHSYEIHTSSND